MIVNIKAIIGMIKKNKVFIFIFLGQVKGSSFDPNLDFGDMCNIGSSSS